MKAEEKQLLHSFFLTASQALEGFRLNSHPHMSSIQFVDDPECNYNLKSHKDCEKNNLGSLAISALCSSEEFKSSSSCVISSIKEKQPPSFNNYSHKIYSSLEDIKADIANCTRCPLSKTRHNVVAGEGPKEVCGTHKAPSILVIGEAPGFDEDEQGRPFVGASGKLLDKMLAAIDLSRSTSCFITNMVKCRPPENRNPTNEEISCCSHFLQEQIRLIAPKMILLLGTVALKAMFHTTEGIMHLHGKLMHYNLNAQDNAGEEKTQKNISIPTIPTYHPSALLRNESLKRPAWDDLKFFKAKLKQIMST